MQIFLSSAFTLLDEGIFKIEPEKAGNLFVALSSMLEKLLGTQQGELLSMTQDPLDIRIEAVKGLYYVGENTEK